jgi:hypothetical protein
LYDAGSDEIARGAKEHRFRELVAVADFFAGGVPKALEIVVVAGAPYNSEGIKQAYVLLHAPVGNGLDFRVGVWDTIIGYEMTDSVNNPNYTRSMA